MIMNENKEYICEKCGAVLKYNGEWDAYYCVDCNEWAEEKCGDPNCCFCPDRPDKPLDSENK